MYSDFVIPDTINDLFTFILYLLLRWRGDGKERGSGRQREGPLSPFRKFLDPSPKVVHGDVCLELEALVCFSVRKSDEE